MFGKTKHTEEKSETLVKVVKLTLDTDQFVEITTENGEVSLIKISTGRHNVHNYIWRSEIQPFLKLCKLLLEYLERNEK